MLINGALSSERTLNWSLPQGSGLGAPLYCNNTRPIGELIEIILKLYHLFADDIQVYKGFNPLLAGQEINTRNQLERCLNEIRDWLSCNKLKLNSDKTEFLTLKTKFQPPTLIKDALSVVLSPVWFSVQHIIQSIRNHFYQ